MITTIDPVALTVTGLLSVSTYFVTLHLVPRVKIVFENAGLFGYDLNKRNKIKVPESLGMVSGCVFLITMFLLIPIIFVNRTSFAHSDLTEFLAALLSICCMILLGFADDVLDLKWRYKLWLPTIATLPLLMVYYVNINSTLIIVPKPLRPIFDHQIDIGLFYYVYMGMLAVFCTNAINIMAGINGLEVGQSLIIGISIILFNILELQNSNWHQHQFSLITLMPFVATSAALYRFNRFPAQVFVGDTYCYLAGMTFAVVGILGHFSKTLLLFFMPQIFNFLYSVPQLFRFLPCPRHRIPKLSESNQLGFSTVKCSRKEIGSIGRTILQIFSKIRLIDYREHGEFVEFNNLTILNFVLLKKPNIRTEFDLFRYLIRVQIQFSGLAFLIRYPLSKLFYD